MKQEDLLRRIQENPRDDAAWAELFILLAEGPQPAVVIGLATSRHQMLHDAALFTYHRVVDLATAGRKEALQRLYEASGESGAFRGLFAYGLALCATREFDLAAAVAYLREAAYVNAQGSRELFAQEEHFCGEILGQMLQQASLLEDAAYASDTPTPPAMELPDLPHDGMLILASCCDTYFQAYGERFVSQLAEALPEAAYLIHVVNPTAEGDALRARLRERFPQGGFSSEAGPDDVKYFASRRFTIAPALRARQGGEMLILDVDSVFEPGFGQVLETSRRHGFAYFGNPGQLAPSLVIAAAYLYLPAQSAVADAVLAHTAAYLDRKLGEPMVPWTVDQMGLFRALCLIGDDRERTMDLARSFPEGVRILVGEGHEVPEKVRMARRVQHDRLNVEFDTDRRPILSVD